MRAARQWIVAGRDSQEGAQVMQVVVLYGQPGAVIPWVVLARFHEGLVLEAVFFGIALPPGIDAVTDYAGALLDQLLVVHFLFAGHSGAFDVEYRRASVKTEIDGQARFETGVREGAVNKLPIADNDITGAADKWYGAFESLAP